MGLNSGGKEAGARRAARAMRSGRAIALLVGLAGVGVCSPGLIEAQDSLPAAHALRIPDGVDMRIDGYLGEEVWEMAEPVTDFTQQEPVEGGVPSERTEIRILFDRDALYIGGRFFDDPSGVLAYQRQRDVGLGTDDRFMWILDTFRDGQTGYFFETNPAGLMGDGIISGGGGMGMSKSWDGIWEVRTQILDDGWSAEIRIPFSTINFDPALDSWGINFQRTIRRRNEEIVWRGWRRTQPLTRPVHAGRLEGLSGISQGVGVEAKPYLVGSANQAGEGDWDRSAKTGVDVSYSITPGLRAAVTVNTDFAEVEVDQRRVNLTRFPLRFPEQRGFFLEGSGVFSFAPAQGTDPFFSRRIGLVDGEEVPITWGARLGGQAGPWGLGFFQIRTGEAELGAGDAVRTVPGEDFTIARVRRGIFTQSHIGAIYTRRATDPIAGETSLLDRQTAGADLSLYTSSWMGRYNAQFEAFFVAHTDPVKGGSTETADRVARGVRVSFPNDVYQFHASLRDFGTAWDPAAGFVSRRGFRRFQPTVVFAPRPARLAAVRQMQWQVEFEYLTDLENVLQTRNLGLTLLQLNFESGDFFSVTSERRFERLDRTFRIHGEGADAIFVSEGDYETTSWQVQARAAGRRRVSGNIQMGGGDFWSGTIREYQAGLTARPWPGVSMSSSYSRNEVRLPEGAFETNLTRLSGSWDASPLTSLTANVQYDDVSRVLGVFARARWIVRAGNDIFLVYTHNWRSLSDALFDREMETLSRGGAFKLNYTYRF